MRRRACSSAAALFAIALSLAGQTGGSGYIITGTVRLPDGSPAARAMVRATNQSGLDRQIFADDMGRYEMRDLPGGRYRITAISPADATLYADPVEVEATRLMGMRYIAHINLRSKVDATEPKENKGSTISVAEASQQVPKAAQRAFEQGLRFRSSQDVPKALRSLDRAIELFPEYFQAYAERGHLRIGTGQISEAAEDFERALALNERYEPALRGAGICKVQRGRFEGAVADLERATALEPRNATSYLFLGVASAALDRRDAARAAFQKALALDAAGAARAHVHLASLAMKENRLEDAALEIRKYLAAVPNAPDAEKLRAVEADLRARLGKP